MMECAYEGLEANLAAEKPGTLQKVISFFREGASCKEYDGCYCVSDRPYCFYRSMETAPLHVCAIGKTKEEIRESFLRTLN